MSGTATLRIEMMGVPLDLGAGRRGVDMGPSALRLARLGEELRSLGHALNDHGNLPTPLFESQEPGEPHARFMGAIADVNQSLCAQLSALPPGGWPLVLGGDHAVGFGSYLGARAYQQKARRGRPTRVGLLWVDAHADLNTPDSSPSGNVHGMPLAHLLGEGDPRLLQQLQGEPLASGDVVLVGVRSVDGGERRRIRDRGIRAFSMSDIDRVGMARVVEEALAALAHVDVLHLSFDADVLDPAWATGVGTPVPGGLTYREAHLLMEMLADSGRVCSADVVEVNPILDQHNRTATLMVELLASLLGRTILGTDTQATPQR